MSDKREQPPKGGLPPMPDKIELAAEKPKMDTKRLIYIGLGLAFFVIVYLIPHFPDAVDPKGAHFALSREGQGSIGLFLLAGAEPPS